MGYFLLLMLIFSNFAFSKEVKSVYNASEKKKIEYFLSPEYLQLKRQEKIKSDAKKFFSFLLDSIRKDEILEFKKDPFSLLTWPDEKEKMLILMEEMEKDHGK